MPELKIKIPRLLENDSGKLEKEVEELISFEEKRKMLLLFIDEVMRGAKQLSDRELIKLGRDVKQGRSEELRHLGLI